jgi:hypothetical protein
MPPTFASPRTDPVDEKRERVAQARSRFQQVKARYPGVSDEDLKLVLIAGRLATMRAHGPWNDKWLDHPLPTMAEPDKAIAHLTDYGDLDVVHAARLFGKVSLRAIDRFFMQVRRAVSVIGRPIRSPRTAERVWRGRSAHNPEVVVKLLEMYRVVLNHVETGTNGRTPAMRLGLAEGRIRFEDIIYFIYFDG